jgi:hypothetical protein
MTCLLRTARVLINAQACTRALREQRCARRQDAPKAAAIAVLFSHEQSVTEAFNLMKNSSNASSAVLTRAECD